MELVAGLQVMHQTRALELLYLVTTTPTKPPTQYWKCKLLFVEPQEVVEQFIEGDRVTKLHSAPAKNHAV